MRRWRAADHGDWWSFMFLSGMALDVETLLATSPRNRKLCGYTAKSKRVSLAAKRVALRNVQIYFFAAAFSSFCGWTQFTLNGPIPVTCTTSPLSAYAK